MKQILKGLGEGKAGVALRSSYRKVLRLLACFRLLHAFLLLVFLQVPPAVGAGESDALGRVGVAELTEPGKAFKEYQIEAPPVKYLEYEQSYADGKHGPGVLLGDGAIQPGGYFTRHLKNSPYTSGILVDGASVNDEWEYFPENQNTTYGPRTDWTNFSASAIFPGLLQLQTVARLGLPRPFPARDKFTWFSQTNFSFQGPYCAFEGSITVFDAFDRPRELEFHSVNRGTKLSSTTRIFYNYDSDHGLFPSSFVAELNKNGETTMTTNTLRNLVLGTNEHAVSGYFLRDFVPDSAKIQSVYYISNHVRYLLQPDGALKKYTYPNKPGRTLHAVRRSIIFTFLVVSTIIMVYLVRRRGA